MELTEWTEPREGVAPFAAGIESQGDDGDFVYIVSKAIEIGPLGKASIILQQTSKGKIEEEISKDDQAFTVDLSGKIHRGNLRDFFKQGYYGVSVEIEPYGRPIDEVYKQLRVDIWIDKTEPIVSTGLVNFDDTSWAGFSRLDKQKGIKEQFVLPSNPEILQAIRISVSSRQENPIESTSG